MTKTAKRKSVSYAKWGYIFIIPFFVVYLIFTLYPQITTVWYSFNQYYYIGAKPVGPTFNGINNYIKIFTPDAGVINIFKYLGNTMIMWIICALPQFIVSLVLAVIFTSARLNIKFSGFFKSVFYMPNLIMASAFGMLFWALFARSGPINFLLQGMGWIPEGALAEVGVNFLGDETSLRVVIGLLNYVMWFGNTTIMLMAGIQGIDESMFESAKIDGANSIRVFTDITMPLLRPIFIYVFITSMIGGIQMFDVPQIMTAGDGGPRRAVYTIVMYLNKLVTARNYGEAGAVSVILLAFTGILSGIVFKTTNKED